MRMIDRVNSGLCAIADVRGDRDPSYDDLQGYDFDLGAPLPPDDGLFAVEFEDVDFELSSEILTRLIRTSIHLLLQVILELTFLREVFKSSCCNVRVDRILIITMWSANCCNIDFFHSFSFVLSILLERYQSRMMETRMATCVNRELILKRMTHDMK